MTDVWNHLVHVTTGDAPFEESSAFDLEMADNCKSSPLERPSFDHPELRMNQHHQKRSYQAQAHDHVSLVTYGTSAQVTASSSPPSLLKSISKSIAKVPITWQVSWTTGERNSCHS
jgi:hypothetical protein